MKTTHYYTANTRAAEIVCEAKQAIENFKNGTVETVSMDTFLQELVWYNLEEQKILDDKSEIAKISDEKIAELLKDLLSNH